MTFRKSFALQYSSILAVNHLFSIDTKLSSIVVDMKSGSLSLNNLRFTNEVDQTSPYSVRLSRNLK